MRLFSAPWTEKTVHVSLLLQCGISYAVSISFILTLFRYSVCIMLIWFTYRSRHYIGGQQDLLNDKTNTEKTNDSLLWGCYSKWEMRWWGKVCLNVCLLIFETGSPIVVEAGLELLHPLASASWVLPYRCALPHLPEKTCVYFLLYDFQKPQLHSYVTFI